MTRDVDADHQLTGNRNVLNQRAQPLVISFIVALIMMLS